jgi:hypothetical protein
MERVHIPNNSFLIFWVFAVDEPNDRFLCFGALYVSRDCLDNLCEFYNSILTAYSR